MRRVERRIERHERPGAPVIQVHRVVRRGGIAALAQQRLFLRLEGAGDVDRLADAQENRTRVIGQALGEMGVQPGEVETLAGDDRRHSGAAVGAGNRHAIDHRFDHSRTQRR